MNDNIVALAADTSALLFSIDDLPKIGFTVCSDRSLNAAVAGVMFPTGMHTQADREELDSYVAALRDTGAINFEDGWLKLCVGTRAIVVFLMDKLKTAAEDAAYEDRLRADEHVRGAAFKKKYDDLCAALIEALGDKAPPIVARAAADIIAGAQR